MEAFSSKKRQSPRHVAIVLQIAFGGFLILLLLSSIPGTAHILVENFVETDSYHFFDTLDWEPADKIPCALIRMTWRHSPRCSQTSNLLTQLLITGAGRSGTKGTSLCFSNAGLNFIHDNRMNITDDIDGAVSWPTMFRKFNEHWMVFVEGHLFKHVFLQTRDPLKTIGSRASHVEPVKPVRDLIQIDWIRRPRSNEDNLLLAMKYWVLWNTFGSLTSDAQFRVEDRSGKYMEYLWTQWAGGSTAYVDFAKCDQTSSSANHGRVPKHQPATWTKLNEVSPKWTMMVKILGKKFGYDIPNVPDSSDFYCWVNDKNRWECDIDGYDS